MQRHKKIAMNDAVRAMEGLTVTENANEIEKQNDRCPASGLKMYIIKDMERKRAVIEHDEGLREAVQSWTRRGRGGILPLSRARRNKSVGKMREVKGWGSAACFG